MRGRPKKSRHRSVRLPERFSLPAEVVRAHALHLRHSLKSSPEFSPPPVCLCCACVASALRAGRFASSRERFVHPEGLTEILTRSLYALTRRRSTTISLNVARCPRNAPWSPRKAVSVQWLRDDYEWDSAAAPVLDWGDESGKAKERDRHEQVR